MTFRKPSDHVSWQVLPEGRLVPLTTTQDLLCDMVPLVEDMVVLAQELRSTIAQCAKTRAETHALVVRSRRQRLGLGLVKNRGGRLIRSRRLRPIG